jgi:hypothetical protein
MKNLPTARMEVVTVDIFCAWCHESIAAPDGPSAWDVNAMQAGAVVTCTHCQKESRLPQVLKRTKK